MKRSWSNAFSRSSSPGFVNSEQYYSQSNYMGPNEYHSPNNYGRPNYHSSPIDNNMSGQFSHNWSNVSISFRSSSTDDQIRPAYRRNFTPPGFVYFDQPPCQDPADTSDFLSFSSSPAPPYRQNFSPVNYQIPSNYTGPDKYNNPNNYNSPNYHSNSSHHSSSHDSNISGHFSVRKSGNYRYKTSYSSSDADDYSHFNNSRERNGNNKWNKESIHRGVVARDISRYYDPICTLDPWLELEQEYNMKKALKDNLTNKAEDTAVDSVEMDEEMDTSDSDDSSDSDTSDSEEETT